MSHERHQSDVVSVSSEVRQVAGEHRRNLSDSQALGKEAALELASLHVSVFVFDTYILLVVKWFVHWAHDPWVMGSSPTTRR